MKTYILKDKIEFEIVQKHYQRRDIAARQWKSNGGKVVGYICGLVPEELILAAGMFPYRLSGDPGESSELSDGYLEPFYRKDIRSILEGILKGKFDFIDYLIIPHAHDAVFKLYQNLLRIKQYNNEIKLPQICFFDIPHTRLLTSYLYAKDRFMELKGQLEKWSGRSITDEAISKAIETTNEIRELLRKINTCRKSESPFISGTEILQLTGASIWMKKEEVKGILQQLYQSIEQAEPRTGVRLFVHGSPLDNTELYEMIEEMGATVVGEDSCWGDRYFQDSVTGDGDPMRALMDKYYVNSLCSQMYPMQARLENSLKNALESRAQGVIFYYLEWDNAPMWEYPLQKDLYEKNGIRTTCFFMQPYSLKEPDRKQIKIKIKEFISGLSK